MSIEERISESLAPIEPANLVEPIRYTLSQGGKRIRPQLVFIAAKMFGAEQANAAYVAAAFEMLHNFTLIHDDIMDEAPIRRNQPTVYKKWNPNIAILSGDALATLAIREILKTPVKAETVVRLSDLLSQTCVEVCSGQQYDLDFESLGNVSLEQYIKMIRLKTSVLLAACLKAGAILANAPENDQKLIYEAGIELGLAFQLKDDWLDIYSDTETFGKVCGGDIRENKKTYLFLRALQDANPEDYKTLKECFLPNNMDFDTKFKTVSALYDKLDIRHKTEAAILEHVALSLNAIDKIALPAERKQELVNLVNTLTYRAK